MPSRPVWGAWIEIGRLLPTSLNGLCRAPYGARGLKFELVDMVDDIVEVAPRMGRVD